MGDSWFRVSSSVSREGSGGPQRSKAPLSVTSDKGATDFDTPPASLHHVTHAACSLLLPAPAPTSAHTELSDRNVYFHAFTEQSLPLDGAFEGASTRGHAVRHGVTNDVR